MTILPFVRRGTFKITGFYSEVPNPKANTPFLYAMVYRTFNRGWRKFFQWYRKPSLTDRGPFTIIGWCPPHKYRPYTHAAWVPLRYCRYFLGQPFFPEGKTLKGTPWIYYSRNISTATTCH